MKKNSFIVLLIALSTAGACLSFLSTSGSGIHVELSSTYYLAMARLFENYNLNKDMLGFFMCHFQPLFPFVLSWGHTIGIEPLEAARWLNSMLFGLNVMLIGIITRKYTLSWSMGLLASFLMLLSPDILGIHLTAVNEPLFIFFMLVWLFLSFEYLKNSKLSVLILSSLVVTLASMTRFSGIPMIATGIFVIFFLNQKSNFMNKLSHALIFTSFPCLVLVLWSRSSFLESAPLQRHFAFHPVNFSQFRDMISVFYSWFLPPNFYISANEKTLLLVIGTVFCFIGLFLRHAANIPARNAVRDNIFKRFSIFGIIFICLYALSLVLAASFYDVQMFDCWGRYFILIHITAIIICCGILSNLVSGPPSSFKKDIAIIIITYFFLFDLIGTTKCLMNQYYGPDVTANDPYRFSYIIRKVKAMPPGAPIYSNDFLPIYIWADKISLSIPPFQNPLSLQKNDKYMTQIFKMAADIRNKKGLLVYFIKGKTQGVSFLGKYTETIETLQKRIPLHLIARDKYASIYDVP